ncbi:MAG: endonuclease/exonuclease/phosphatase family protein [Verrucomicrobiota bacterium]
MRLRSGWTIGMAFFLLLISAEWNRSAALSLLTYNTGGNGAADWSTNAAQVQAIGRQMQFLKPDIITFNEIPFEHSGQMTHFVRAFLPDYILAINSGTDGFIRSAIISRFPIVRSQKWLDGVSLSAFGYNGAFTRDLFEAEISVPGFAQPLHVFTAHLKAGSDADSASRRAAEASAISNFFVNTFLPVKEQRPYVLTGDFNEDIQRPPAASRQAVQRMVNTATGLRLTTPVNPFNGNDRTLSIRTTLTVRFDYVLPGALLFSNITSSQVFRTDLLPARPVWLQKFDSVTASDHLPVFIEFRNPFDGPFRLTSIEADEQTVTFSWESMPGRIYRVEHSSDFNTWTEISGALTATGDRLNWTGPRPFSNRFFRVMREP